MVTTDTSINTLGALRATDYQSRSIKEELRENLIAKLKAKEKVFDGIIGFDDTVLPDIEPRDPLTPQHLVVRATWAG